MTNLLSLLATMFILLLCLPLFLIGIAFALVSTLCELLIHFLAGLVRKTSLLLLLCLASLTSQAATLYCGPSATGNGSGSDWSNLIDFDTLSLVRGDTYYIRDSDPGNYAGKTFSTAQSGTTLITVKKATASDHGTDTGWTAAMGDGQALFSGQVNFTTGYWVFDGMTGGGPNSWKTGLGIKVSNTAATPVIRTEASNVTIRHCEVVGNDGSAQGGGSVGNDCFAFYGGNNITVSYCYAHDAGRTIFFGGSADTTIEYTYTGDLTSSSETHAETASIWNFWGTAINNWTFRYSVIGHAEGTGGIIYEGSNLTIHGCVFFREAGLWDNANGVVGTWTVSTLTGLKVYNCTFIDTDNLRAFGLLDGNDSGEVKNCLFYSLSIGDIAQLTHTHNHYVSMSAPSESNSSTASGDPFVDYANLDFALTANTPAGTDLGAPYNVDMFGRTRTTWTRGAVEYAAEAGIIPSSRRITWDPGVRGGIMINATQTVSQSMIVFTNLATNVTTSAFNSAIANCPSNQVIQLTNGVYDLTSTLNVAKDGIVIRGKGQGQTVLRINPSFSGDPAVFVDDGYDYDWNATPVRNLTNCLKGSATITTTVNHGWAVGDIILIDMLEDVNGDPANGQPAVDSQCTWCGRPDNVGNRPMGQFAKVTDTPTLSTAVIDPPLYFGYWNQPQAMKMGPWVERVGFESLTLNTLDAASDGSPEFCFKVQGALNCWWYDVEFKGNYSRGMWGYGGFWNTIKHCTIYGNAPVGADGDDQYGSGRAYGLFLGAHWSAGLIEDCIFDKLTLAIAFEGGASGNVIGYNYVTNMWWEEDITGGNWPIRFGFLAHGPHPFMNLFEGNWTEARLRTDNLFGSNSHWTHLRNCYQQRDRRPDPINGLYSQSETVDLEKKSHFHSFVGNNLGTGWEDDYRYNGASFGYESGPKKVWKLGYAYNSVDSAGHDTNVAFTLLDWGNWQSQTNNSTTGSGILWITNNVADPTVQTIPQSYYLPGKPAWFGNLEFPVFAPGTSTDPNFIPSGFRANQGVPPPPGQDPNTSAKRGNLVRRTGGGIGLGL